jgi:hypothetical protein
VLGNPVLRRVLPGLASLLQPWGSAGRFTLLAEVLPARAHLAANAVVGTLAELGTARRPAVGTPA